MEYPHRKIYIAAHGEIPKGMICHHCNQDHSDNRIENLILMSKGLHIIFHRVMKWLEKYPDSIVKLGQGLITYGESLKTRSM